MEWDEWTILPPTHPTHTFGTQLAGSSTAKAPMEFTSRYASTATVEERLNRARVPRSVALGREPDPSAVETWRPNPVATPPRPVVVTPPWVEFTMDTRSLARTALSAIKRLMVAWERVGMGGGGGKG